MRRCMSNLVSGQGTDLQMGQPVSDAAHVIPPVDCGGGEDCFYCTCPETD
jgi:hypothetical protein